MEKEKVLRKFVERVKKKYKGKIEKLFSSEALQEASTEKPVTQTCW